MPITQSRSARQRTKPDFTPNEFDLARLDRAEQKRRIRQIKAPVDTTGALSHAGD